MCNKILRMNSSLFPFFLTNEGFALGINASLSGDSSCKGSLKECNESIENPERSKLVCPIASINIWRVKRSWDLFTNKCIY